MFSLYLVIFVCEDFVVAAAWLEDQLPVITYFYPAGYCYVLHCSTNSIQLACRIPVMSIYSKTCVKRPLSKRPKNGLQDRLSLHACQKYCRMLQREHSAMFSTFIKLPVVIETFALSTLSGCFSQVLLCIVVQTSVDPDQLASIIWAYTVLKQDMSTFCMVI